MKVSIDAGNGYIKVRSNATALSYPAVVSPVSDRLQGFHFSLGREPEWLVAFGGEEYAVGRAVATMGVGQNTIRHPDRIESHYYLIQIATAMAVSLARSGPVEAILSLPPQHYARREEMRDWLAREYEVELYANRQWLRKVFQMEREHIHVIPEGLGAICLNLLTAEGKIRASGRIHQQRVGVIDIGTYSTDFIRLDALTLVPHACDTIPQALNQVHQTIRNLCSAKGVVISDVEADTVLQQGYFTHRGQRVSVVDDVQRELEHLAESIYNRILTLWNGANDVDVILVTGGGAPLLFDLLRNYLPNQVNATWSDDIPPWMENCEGAYRYLKLREGNGKT